MPSPKKILVVDDEQTIVKFCKMLLERFGHTVVTCDSGEEALLLCSKPETSPDVVLLDLTMPGLSGEETFKRIKSGCAGTQVILMTGKADAGFAGDYTLLNKPFTVEALRAAIDAV